MGEILNKVSLNYQFGDDSWDYELLLTIEDIREFYGNNAINKTLFCYLDFARLMEQEDYLVQWLKDKYQKNAYEEYQRYML